MKKLIMVFSIFSVFFLGGCSFLNEVNNSLDYATNATDYVNEVKQFSEEIPTLAEQAVTDSEARVTLEEELTQMKADIQEFNELEPPGVAEDIHQSIVGHNETLEKGIDKYLTHVENGEVDLKFLEESEIFATANEITELLDAINKLSGE
ncbi:DUF6376 family protein [Metabacillus arenae]|uniref:Lipoprotein n=1 Tax=Metabacillus arenae TaxID=2771434 RepID=A0A926N901_9BACI|nr:DUF6376 family protein [Metabacillus arenae]MBD1379702.1 hypothetical protein [Metabacillus arenae]